MYVLIPFLLPLFLPGSRIPGAASGCPPDPQHLLRFRSSAQRREGGDLGLSCSGRGQQLGFVGAEGYPSVPSSALGSPACKRAKAKP